MTEEEAIALVTLKAQTDALPVIDAGEVEAIVRRNARAGVWTPETTYRVGQVVQPTQPNGHFYKCVANGTSDEVEPTWSYALRQNSQISEFASDLVWEECETDFDGNRFNLRNAIHECWVLKASMSAKDYDIKIGDQTWNRSQVHEHCKAMAQAYAPFD